MSSTSTATKNDSQDQYESAVKHYLSPKRQDAVKTKWENPFSSYVIGSAIQNMEQEGLSETLRVVDFGCGIGGGFTLVQNALETIGLNHRKTLSYLGVDNSLKMVHVAEQKWSGQDNVSFQMSDFRVDVPDQPFDMYLSCGVPYSHLTKEETQQTLANICHAIKRNKTRSLIVVDVLGQYSIEWVSQWQESRWPYRMSFLADGQAQDSMMMTCYYAPELKAMIHQVAEQQGCYISSIDCFDRSIMVGRHTSTREYNPSIPPYRELINSLYEPDQSTDFSSLMFQGSLPEAPVPVEQFFQNFSQQWNQLVQVAAHFAGDRQDLSEAAGRLNLTASRSFELLRQLYQELEQLQGSLPDQQWQSSGVEPTLAKYLNQLEQTQQPGLGVGHTLIALVYVDGTR